MRESVVGIFVGGSARRLGGIPKGLLRHPVEPTSLVERALSLGRRLGSETVLVGSRDPYADLGVVMLADSPAGIGPMGGLAALVAYAASRDVIAIACDMPYVPFELVERLSVTAGGDAVVPRRTGGLEPLCALYRPDAVRPVLQRAIAEGRFGLQSVLAQIAVRELVLTAGEQSWLDDWDEPSDVASK